MRYGILKYDDVEVNYSYTEGEQANTWGLPEDCHDGNPPEIEIISIMVGGVDVYDFFETYGDIGKLIDSIYEKEWV